MRRDMNKAKDGGDTIQSSNHQLPQQLPQQLSQVQSSSKKDSSFFSSRDNLVSSSSSSSKSKLKLNISKPYLLHDIKPSPSLNNYEKYEKGPLAGSVVLGSSGSGSGVVGVETVPPTPVNPRSISPLHQGQMVYGQGKQEYQEGVGAGEVYGTVPKAAYPLPSYSLRSNILSDTNPDIIDQSQVSQSIQQHYPMTYNRNYNGGGGGVGVGGSFGNGNQSHGFRPRTSLNVTLRNLALRPKDSWHVNTIIDSRKVFALPAFLHVNSLDDILLHELIAQGGLGAIWKGELLTSELTELNNNNKMCAVKVIIFEWKNEDEFLEVLTAFRQEVTIIYALSPHPNIVRLLGYAETPSNDLVLVEELCDADLKSILHDKVNDIYVRRVSMDDILVLLAGIFDGLVWMHQHGVIHNDMKPQNVLVCINKVAVNDTKEGGGYRIGSDSSYGRVFKKISNALYVPKICDMGLAAIEVPDSNAGSLRVFESASGVPSEAPTKASTRTVMEFITETLRNEGNGSDNGGSVFDNVAPVSGRKRSQIKGFSTRYASPEAFGSVPSPDSPSSKNMTIYGEASINFPPMDFKTQSKTDMWAMGVIIWELLNRRPPYEFMNDDQVRALVMMGKAELSFMKSKDRAEKFLEGLAKGCWAYRPEDRPTSESALSQIEQIVKDLYS